MPRRLHRNNRTSSSSAAAPARSSTRQQQKNHKNEAATGTYEDEEPQLSDLSDGAHSDEEEGEEDHKMTTSRRKRLKKRSRHNSTSSSRSPLSRKQRALENLKQVKDSGGNRPRRRAVSQSSSSTESDEDELTPPSAAQPRSRRQRNTGKNLTVVFEKSYDSSDTNIIVSNDDDDDDDDESDQGGADDYIMHNIMDNEIRERQEFEAQQKVIDICRDEDLDNRLTEKQAFEIYCRFLSFSIFYPQIFTQLRSMPNCHDSKLYSMAVEKIERSLLSKRDSLLTSNVWGEEFRNLLKKRPALRIDELAGASINCQVCKRANRPSSYVVEFKGFAYESLYFWDDGLYIAYISHFPLAAYAKEDRRNLSKSNAAAINESMNDAPSSSEYASQTSSDRREMRNDMNGDSSDEVVSPERPGRKLKKRTHCRNCSDTAPQDSSSTEEEGLLGRQPRRLKRRSTRNNAFQNTRRSRVDGAIEIAYSSEEDEDSTRDSLGSDLNDEDRTSYPSPGRQRLVNENRLYWEDFIPRFPSAFKNESDSGRSIVYYAGRFCTQRAQTFHNLTHFKLYLMNDIRECFIAAFKEIQTLNTAWAEVVSGALALDYPYQRMAQQHKFPPPPPTEAIFQIFASKEWCSVVKRWYDCFKDFETRSTDLYATSGYAGSPWDPTDVFENEIGRELKRFPVFASNWRRTYSMQPNHWIDEAHNEDSDTNNGRSFRRKGSQRDSANVAVNAEARSPTRKADQSIRRREAKASEDQHASEEEEDRSISTAHSESCRDTSTDTDSFDEDRQRKSSPSKRRKNPQDASYSSRTTSQPSELRKDNVKIRSCSSGKEKHGKKHTSTAHSKSKNHISSRRRFSSVPMISSSRHKRHATRGSDTATRRKGRNKRTVTDTYDDKEPQFEREKRDEDTPPRKRQLIKRSHNDATLPKFRWDSKLRSCRSGKKKHGRKVTLTGHSKGQSHERSHTAMRRKLIDTNKDIVNSKVDIYDSEEPELTDLSNDIYSEEEKRLSWWSPNTITPQTRRLIRRSQRNDASSPLSPWQRKRRAFESLKQIKYSEENRPRMRAASPSSSSTQSNGDELTGPPKLRPRSGSHTDLPNDLNVKFENNYDSPDTNIIASDGDGDDSEHDGLPVDDHISLSHEAHNIDSHGDDDSPVEMSPRSPLRRFFSTSSRQASGAASNAEVTQHGLPHTGIQQKVPEKQHLMYEKEDKEQHVGYDFEDRRSSVSVSETEGSDKVVRTEDNVRGFTPESGQEEAAAPTAPVDSSSASAAVSKSVGRVTQPSFCLVM